MREHRSGSATEAHGEPTRFDRARRHTHVPSRHVPDAVPLTEVIGEVEVVVQLGIEVHIVPHVFPRPSAKRHVRPPQRCVAERGECEHGVRTQERMGHRHALRAGAVVENGTAGHRIHSGIAQGLDHARHPGGSGKAVGVEAQQHVAAGGVVTRRSGCGDAALAAENDPGARGARDGGTVVGGTVVDDDDLIGRHGLRFQGSQAPPEVRCVVQDRDDDRHGALPTRDEGRCGAFGHDELQTTRDPPR
ncbi:MAG: hypothetical protein K0S37_1596 [Microbacterium sp.]|nr:hypothetical protein [Microbacterium sp.]